MIGRLGADRNQKILLELASQPGNDMCADCKSRMPRWASYNIGIFICVRCASIHRKIGTHVSKVKSLTMDTWSKEQVETMKQVGNIKSNRSYNPDEMKHPPPTNMMESERDSELEKFIRDKYEFKKFKPSPSAVAASLLGPSRSAAQVRLAGPSTRSATLSPSTPTTTSTSILSSTAKTAPPAPPPQRSMTQPPPAIPSTVSPPATTTAPGVSSSSTFNDLLSLQAPSVSSSLPLQYSPLPAASTLPGSTAPLGIPGSTPNFAQPQLGMGMAMGTSPSAFGSGMGISPSGFNATLGPSPNPAFAGLSSSPAGLNPFQQQPSQMGFNSGSSGFMTSSPGMNPFQAQQQQFQPQPQLAQPAPFAAQPGTNPFGTSPFLSAAQGPGTSPSPLLMQTNPGFAPSSSPGISIGMGTNPTGMNGGFGMGMNGMGMGMQPQGMANPFGQMQQQQQQPFGQQGAFGQQNPFGQNPFGAQPVWQQQQQGWTGM